MCSDFVMFGSKSKTIINTNNSSSYLVLVPGVDIRRVRACINDVPKIKIGKNQNQNWALIGRGSKTSRLRLFIFGKSLPNQRSPQGLRPDLMRDRKRRSKTKNGVFRSGIFRSEE